MNVTSEVIREVAPHVKKNSLLMDFTSVKEIPCKVMSSSAREGVEIIGAHPLFGPRVNSLKGQVVILTPVRSKRWLPWLREWLEKNKARVVITTPQEHDRMMAVVQGLTHFSYISVGATLKELGIDLKHSRQFSSPVYELMLDMIGRIIGQNPHLYAEIQMQNPHVTKVHRVFLRTAHKLSKAVKEKDEKAFVSIMAAAARHFDDVDQAMGRSDKAIRSLVNELEELEKKIGQEIGLEHIYSNKKHFGKVIEVTPEWVILEHGGKKLKLKLSNLRILSPREEKELLLKIFGAVKRDYSFIFPENVSEKLLSQLLKKMDGVYDVEIKDVYRGSQISKGHKSICFSLAILNRNVKDKEIEVKNFLMGLGGEMR